MPFRRQLLALPILLLPASCAFLQTAKPDRIFALMPLPPAPLLPSNNAKITVAEPVALRVLDTGRIANRSGDLEFQYYSGALWEDRAPAVLQNLLIASLRHRIQADVSSDNLVNAGASLTSDLQDFQIEPGNQIHITLVANFAGMTKTFETRQTAASDYMTDLVSAFNQGCQEILSEIVAWVASAPAAPGIE